MTVELPAELVDRARVHAALGDPVRLAIVDALLWDDASPGEVARALGLGTNLVAHHLQVLQDAGVIERTRSGRADRPRAATVGASTLCASAYGATTIGRKPGVTSHPPSS